MPRSTVQYGDASEYGTVRWSMVGYGAVWYRTARYGMILGGTVWYVAYDVVRIYIARTVRRITVRGTGRNNMEQSVRNTAYTFLHKSADNRGG